MELSPECTRMLLKTKVYLYYQVTGHLPYKFSTLHTCSSVAHWSEKFWMDNQKATVPSIEKSVYVHKRVCCFSIYCGIFYKILLFLDIFFYYSHNRDLNLFMSRFHNKMHVQVRLLTCYTAWWGFAMCAQGNSVAIILLHGLRFLIKRWNLPGFDW